ncbi:transport protein SgaT [Klebsiella pneumoniae]|uniref:Transport protein SgaT n=1 Tax=Klebsiella pneumoniae TaxID=573 RepID=A0A3S4KLH8_KLEPN|nr:transport protein SgaT [Klebsiella pneumoniae]
MLILIGGFLLGSWSAISPAIGQRYTRQVTEDGGIAHGPFRLSRLTTSRHGIASRTGNPANSFADTEISEKWGLSARYHGHHRYRDVCYLLCLQRCRRVGVLSTITDQNMLIFSVLTGLQFAVGVAIVL